jgi:uncharacterized protein (TIGR02246 family)
MRAILVMVAVILTGPCLAQDKSTIQALEDQLSKALSSGDGKAAAAIYTEDATLLPPGEPSVSGRAAIEAYWTKSSAGIAELKLTTGEVQPMGSDYVREIGTYAGKTKGDAPQAFSGKYVLIFTKTPNTWLATTDIWNSDK